MKRYITPIAIIVALYIAWGQLTRNRDVQGPPASSDQAVATAFSEQRSGVQVTGEGVVVKILSDDRDGDAHQRFILGLASGQTVLIAHNIDIAPRIEPLDSGDSVAFNGVYEWNSQGGTIHWTHHDPGGQHTPGWIKHRGRTFE